MELFGSLAGKALEVGAGDQVELVLAATETDVLALDLPDDRLAIGNTDFDDVHSDGTGALVVGVLFDVAGEGAGLHEVVVEGTLGPMTNALSNGFTDAIVGLGVHGLAHQRIQLVLGPEGVEEGVDALDCHYSLLLGAREVIVDGSATATAAAGRGRIASLTATRINSGSGLWRAASHGNIRTRAPSGSLFSKFDDGLLGLAGLGSRCCGLGGGLDLVLITAGAQMRIA